MVCPVRWKHSMILKTENNNNKCKEEENESEQIFTKFFSFRLQKVVEKK